MKQSILLAFLIFLAGCFNTGANTTPKQKIGASQIAYERKDSDCSSDDCTTIQVKFPGLPEQDLSPLVFGRISGELNDVLLQRVAGEGVARTPEELGDDVLSLFNEQKKKGNPHPWKIQRAGQILFSNKDLLTLEVIGYEFTGGAHGLAWRKLMSFDLKDGRLLTLKEVIDPDQWKLFSDVAEFEFRKIRDIPVGQSLKEAGFTFPEGSQFSVNDNFGIVGDGIVIQYNPYDVAAYAAGPTEIVIPAMALRAVLNKTQASTKHLLDDVDGAVSLALTSDEKK